LAANGAFTNLWPAPLAIFCELAPTSITPNDPHTLWVVGLMSNMPEFAKTWGCRAAAKMIRPNACLIL
jgi:hypothetical protein